MTQVTKYIHQCTDCTHFPIERNMHTANTIRPILLSADRLVMYAMYSTPLTDALQHPLGTRREGRIKRPVPRSWFSAHQDGMQIRSVGSCSDSAQQLDTVFEVENKNNGRPLQPPTASHKLPAFRSSTNPTIDSSSSGPTLLSLTRITTLFRNPIPY
jgi:hypothetical protein